MIKEGKIKLRAVEEDDLSQLRTWRNNTDFRKNFREVRELNMYNQKVWFKKISESRNDFMFSILDFKSEELIGACGLLYIDWIIRSADFSFYIGKNDEYIDSNGYGKDAVEALLKYGFNILNLNKVWMELYEFDKKKLDFFTSECNFKIDGQLRRNCFYNGRYYDSYILSLLASEFSKI